MLLAVFMAGLMVGRTPEYLGKKIESLRAADAHARDPRADDDRAGAARAVGQRAARTGRSRAYAPPHGFSEVLYAFASMTGNNGSAYASFTGNTLYYNVVGSFAMLGGRFGAVIPMLALAGSMGPKRQMPRSLGTLRTDSIVFGGFTVGTIVIVGALSFFAALALGPIAEQAAMPAAGVLP